MLITVSSLQSPSYCSYNHTISLLNNINHYLLASKATNPPTTYRGYTNRRWRNMVVYKRAANNNILSPSFTRSLYCSPPHPAIDKQARNCNRNSGEQFQDKKITTNKSRRGMRIRVSQEFNTKMHYFL